MLGNNYIKINSTGIPNPVGYSFNNDASETVNLSESGKELVNVTRLNKYKASFKWQMSSYWANKIQEYCNKSTVTLTVDNIDRTVRMRDYAAELVENSEHSKGTQGYWIVTCSATEI